MANINNLDIRKQKPNTFEKTRESIQEKIREWTLMGLLLVSTTAVAGLFVPKDNVEPSKEDKTSFVSAPPLSPSSQKPKNFCPVSEPECDNLLPELTNYQDKQDSVVGKQSTSSVNPQVTTIVLTPPLDKLAELQKYQRETDLFTGITHLISNIIEKYLYTTTEAERLYLKDCLIQLIDDSINRYKEELYDENGLPLSSEDIEDIILSNFEHSRYLVSIYKGNHKGGNDLQLLIVRLELTHLQQLLGDNDEFMEFGQSILVKCSEEVRQKLAREFAINLSEENSEIDWESR